MPKVTLPRRRGTKMWKNFNLSPAQAMCYIPFEPLEIADIRPFFFFDLQNDKYVFPEKSSDYGREGRNININHNKGWFAV